MGSPPPQTNPGSPPGVALPPVVQPAVATLTPSQRIASHYSPQAFGIGVKEITTGKRPARPPILDAPSAEEALYTEQFLIVPRLPLEHFDDPEFETKTPEEWLAMGKKTGGTAAVSKYYEGGQMVWAPCRVVGYNSEDETYEVCWDATNRKKSVKRLNLRFEVEDPNTFDNRLAAAESKRAVQHSKYRLQRYVDEVEQAPVRPPNEDRVSHILRCVAAQVPVEHLPKLEECVEEMHFEYRRAVKYATTKYQAMDPSEEARFKRLDLPLEPPTPPVPYSAQVQIPEPRMDFQACNVAIRSNLFRANEQVVKAMKQMSEAFENVKTELFINVGPDENGKYTGPVTMESFLQRQKDHVAKLVEVLNIDWRGEALHGVVNHLEDVFDFKHYSYEAYKVTHLFRFLRMVTLVMGSQLRKLVENSVNHFVDFFETTVFSPGSPGPVLLISMELNNNEVQFVPSLDKVKSSILTAFDSIFVDAAKIMKIDSEVFPIIELPPEPLSTVSAQEKHLLAAREKLSNIIDKAMEGPVALQKAYEKFDDLVGQDLKAFRQTISQNAEFNKKEKCQEMAEKYQKLGAEALLTSDNEVIFPLVEVSCRVLKKNIEVKAVELANATLDQLVMILRQKNKQVHTEYNAIFARVQEQPSNPEELTELKAYIDLRASTFEELDAIVNEVNDTIGIFSECNYVTPDDVFDDTCESNVWPSKIQGTVQDAQRTLENEKQKFVEELRDNQKKFEQELEKTEASVKAISLMDNVEKVGDIYESVLTMEEKIAALEKKAVLYQSHEQLLGFPPTEYPMISEILNTFNPYAKLWRIAGSFNESFPRRMDGCFFEIDPEILQKDIGDWLMTLTKMKKQFKGLEAPSRVVQDTLVKLQEFQTHIPLVEALRNPGLRERHWATMSSKLNLTLGVDTSMSLRKYIEMDIEKHMAILEEVSEFATKEFTLERSLEAMLTEWKPVIYDIVRTKDGETFILRGVDDMQTLLDDHIMKTQTMKGSPYIKPHEVRCQDWEKKLIRMQDILDGWLKCQSAWMYLSPIFGSEDIMRQMPKEGKLFKEVDIIWKSTMDLCFKAPNTLTFSSTENLLENFVAANKKLDEVTSGLNAYLETKRAYFPRFFFLANEELLEILSETKDPHRVQPHLSKCFEAIDKLDFTADMDVLGMFSKEKERVPFIERYNPKFAKGNVEIWLSKTEEVMIASLVDVAAKSIAAYPTQKRTDWILAWPGQIVLAVDQLYWTKETEQFLSEKGTAGLREYAKICTDQMLDVVALVRGDLSKNHRTTLGALVTLDLHGRDVLQDELYNEGVNNIMDFSWLAQLRYYFNPEGRGKEPGCAGGPRTIDIRMVNANLPYGYEYLGTSFRLVVTPLTDRCYRTLMGALMLNMGGAPEGPAGTGKTETTKDLAKALSTQCVVFNCSDSLDYLAMAKFFKGLAASGAWACFDEFNRINLEVLSVIAEQISTIQQAIVEGKKEFVFEGTFLKCKDSCAVFITMNPGYAGRSSLPDNLKALFRSCAMMVPNYALIGEISLYSCGYTIARSNAQKIVLTYKLCSEQLSSQDHYDYGMRAVKSVLNAAGNLKRRYTDADESMLVLRSIIDVNLPKFLEPDVPLFYGITSDLFPGLILPPADYSDIMLGMEETAKELNLQYLPPGKQGLENFFTNILQIFEMMIVRHGFMIVGLPFSAKTKAYQVLMGALAKMEERGQGENRVTTITINPKSIHMGYLYGNFDPTSHEWSDGVLAKSFRGQAQNTNDDRKWLIFDGPVDAIWIENMNTVLDDNKKLCLMSGEIIQMNNKMNLIFETMDLKVASPATVSRCGMVYMEPTGIGWRPLVVSWMNTLPATFDDNMKAKMQGLMDWLFPPLDAYAHRAVVEPVETQTMHLARTWCDLMFCLLDNFMDENKFKAIGKKDVDTYLEAYSLFALVWSCGCTSNTEGQTKWAVFFRELMKGEDKFSDPHANSPLIVGAATGLLVPGERPKPVVIQQPFPDTGSVYDYTLDEKTKKWTDWMKTVDRYVVPPGATFTQIIVPTIDKVRYSQLMKLFVEHTKPCLFTGNTGTGKSVYVQELLMTGLSEHIVPLFMGMSAQTQSVQIQGIIDLKLDRRRKGVFGPPPQKKMVVFVDDLNMPLIETYGAQPPIELLRQWADHGGWYDVVGDKSFRQIVDVSFVHAMGFPGGGKNAITQRYSRHMNIIAFCDLSDDSMERIFVTVLDFFFGQGFPGSVAKCNQAVVQGVIETFNTIKKQLLPTPSKSHYTFNLRDLGKVVQGIVMIKPDDCPDMESCARLWVHENLRVFHDRLTDDDDRNWFRDFMKDMVVKHFKGDFEKIFKDTEKDRNKIAREGLRRLCYGDWANGESNRNYCMIQMLDNEDELGKCMDDYLEEYNAQSKTPMKIVLFQFAIEHLSRILRVLRQPQGNCLLVGVGGSGRQSLSRLASFIMSMDIFQVEITKSYSKADWRENMKELIKKAGLGNQMVFLFNDTQIKETSFLEDINNMLNTGEIPNLFETGEKIEITEGVRRAAKEAGQTDFSIPGLFAFFVSECRKNLHLTLAFSPIGNAFRERLRMFPSLVNCTTIDWFAAWPADALQAVAETFLADLDMNDETRQKVCDMCILFHQSVDVTSTKYLREARRFNYVTPTAYLELIQTYMSLLGVNRKKVAQLRDRYKNGLTKLIETEAKVDTMKGDLELLQPKLVVAKKETAELMEFIKVESVGANETRVIVERDQASASKVAGETRALAESCQADLDAAIPALAKAEKALDSIKKEQITEIKALGKPPDNVKLCLSAVMTMLGEKPVMIAGEKPGSKVADYWPTAQKAMNDGAFLLRLKNYDKDNISLEIITKIRKEYIPNENFKSDVIKKSSAAAEGMCVWVLSMEVYERIEKMVKPKKESLAKATKELAEVEAALAIKVAMLKEVEDKISGLNKQLKEATEKKETLEFQADKCEKQLIRANQLISGLGGEKGRWGEQAKHLAKDYDDLTGDVLISSGVVAYLGPFDLLYRGGVITQWVNALQSSGITCSSDFKLQKVLGDPVEIRNWHINGLPKDGFSTDNGIVVKMTRRWPLAIDPQQQANKWVRNKEAENKLQIIKLTDGKFVQILESSITYGTPVLLENILEEMDPVLEPLLLKQIFKSGGVPCIKMGDSVLEFHSSFKFYITTKLPNPHYLPEVSTKVTLINFMITPEGLKDQLLGFLVAKERTDLEEKKVQLTLESAANARKLADVEDQILKVLAEAEDILEDENGVKVLGEAKIISDDVNRKQATADKIMKDIEKARQSYLPGAEVSSVLYFVIDSLRNVDPMYQYSLGWFVALFLKCIDDSEKPQDEKDVPKRLQFLNEYFKRECYRNCCRSIFEKDKLLLSLIMTIAIKNEIDGTMDMTLWRFLITGGVGEPKDPPRNPAKSWLNDKSWSEMCKLSEGFPIFQGLTDAVAKNIDALKEIFDSVAPQDLAWPASMGKFGGPDFSLGSFYHLLLLRCLRGDKLVAGMIRYVSMALGQYYVEPPPFNLENCVNDSTCVTPLVFILCAGQDPMAQLRSFGATVGVKGDKLLALSLGQGQDKKAERYIKDGCANGGWVVLQNCHLFVSWMSKLEKMVEEFTPATVKNDFRLWLTSAPSSAFPVSILQNGVKMINEPPKGLRNNILGSYLTDPISDQAFFDSCNQPEAFRKLLWGLCTFHAVIQDRRNFGPVGWNIAYEFNETDLRICIRQLNIFLNTYDFIPYKALTYLAGQCNYGGRVTDDHDRRCLSTILEDYYSPDIMKDGHTFDDPIYVVPLFGPYESYPEFAKTLPIVQTPKIFGMDDNADIAKDNKEVTELFDAILSTQAQSSGSGGGMSKEQIVDNLARDILDKLPPDFNVEEVMLKYPTMYEESMNTVLAQEMIRFNNLTSVMRPSLINIRKAMKGLVLMSNDLNEVYNAFFDGKVPQLWLGKSFPSLKPLAAYYNDCLARLKFFQDWYMNGQPVVFWFSGFYFPPAFLTGALQNFARGNQYAIDTVELDFELHDARPKTKPECGVYVEGLLAEAFRWDPKIKEINTQMPKQLLTPMPVIHCMTMLSTDIIAKHGPTVLEDGEPHYKCPVYKTSMRRGVLATTGHSTNFVLPIRLPTSKKQKFWIKRGAAMLCASDD